MVAISWQERMHKRLALWAFVTVALLALGCRDLQTESPNTIDLTPFKQLARTSDCSDVQNRLFLIDRTLVLWDRKGSCPDASYLVRLSGSTVDQILCELSDSIAGPVKNCRDDRYKEIFATIIVNLDEPDLGLGCDHVVEQIDF